MAQFDAQINLILNAQKAIKDAEKVAKSLEQKFSRLEKTVAKQGPLDKYIQQNDELVKQNKAQQDIVKINKTKIQQEKAALNYQLRLTAALQRQATVKQALERAGGPSNAGARGRVEGAVKAAKVDPKDLSLQQAVNTLLEKELQIRRELNRTEAAQAAVAGKNKVGAEFDQRVAALRKEGVEERKLLDIENARLKLSALNSKKQTDLARAQQAEVERLIKAEERLIKAQKARARAQKAQRSVAGDALQGAILGGGFPLLFGGPSFSALLGGVGGGIGGGAFGQQASFAGGIAGSVLGAGLDALTQKATELGQALLKPTTNIDTLISSLGIAGTRLNSTIQSLRDLGFESVAAAVAVDSLEEKYGKDTVDALRGLGKEFTEFQNAMQTLGVRIAALVAGPLGGLLNLLAKAAGSAGNAGALGQLSQNLSSENREKFNKRLNELTGGAGISGTISDQTLQTLIDEFDPVAVEKAAEAARKRAEAEKIITDELERQVAFATNAARVESVRLTARRDTFAALRSDLAIQKEKANLAKILLNLQNETEASKIRELNLERNLSAAALQKLEAARQNAIIEAQRQITRDVSSQNQAAAQAYSESLSITQQLADLGQSQVASYQQQRDLLQNQSTIQMALLAERREMELLGVTELELVDAINKKYFQLEEQEKRRLALQQERLRQELIMFRYREQELIDNRELAKLEAARSAAAQIRDMDFARDFELTGKGFGFFGDSEIFKDKRLTETAAQLESYNEQIGKLQARINTLNNEGVDPDKIFPLEQNLENLKQVRDSYQQLQPAIDAAAIAQARFNDAFNLVNPVMQNLVNNLAEVVKGTKSVAEAFASMLDSIGKMLAQKGAEMIAQYIAIGIARAFAGMGGGGGGFGVQPATTGINFSSAFSSGGFGIGGFSTGGFIGPNRVAMVGEQGPELIQAGPTGATVTSNPQSEAALSKYGPGNQGMAASAPGSYTINYNGPTLTFNGDDYIPRSEAGQLIAAGAKQGEARTLNSLRNRRSTRSRIGI